MIAAMHATSKAEVSPEPVDALMELSKLTTAVVAHSLALVDSTVTVAQLRVLVVVSARRGLNIAGVADALGVNPSNASRTCDRLVEAGLLDRREAAGDRRNVALALTSQGEKLISSVLRRRRVFFSAVVAEMTHAERAGLTRAAHAVIEAGRRASAHHRLSADEVHLLEWLV